MSNKTDNLKIISRLLEIAKNELEYSLFPKHFKDEYMRHVVDKKCDAKVCKALLEYTIQADLCKKCGLCARECPTYAISGTVGRDPFTIDPNLCIRCGACVLTCKFDAIKRQ